MRVPRGFTIIEALVAMLIVNVGLLGLATTAAVVTRMIREGRGAALAAALVSTRIERLRLRGCVATTGSENQDGVTIEWEAAVPAVPRARMLRVSVRGAGRHALRDSLTTVVFCP